MDDLQRETTELLAQLLRFDTVNPPGAERAAQEHLAAYLRDAGLEVALESDDPERPNLVATLHGSHGDGETLLYLGHMDTVLADASQWQHSPWSGHVDDDGVLWGRGAVDMKGQVAAEAVAAAALARAGAPFKGTVKVCCVVDEETGGEHGAQWLTRERPELARCDYVINEGGGMVMPYGGDRWYGVCVAEKGTFRFAVRASGRAAHASLPRGGDNALLKLAPVLSRLATGAQPPQDLTDAPRELIKALGGDVEEVIAADPQLGAMVAATLGITVTPTRIRASDKINVIPAEAELKVDCRVPPGVGLELAERRVRELLGDALDGLELDFFEQIVGNASPIESKLMDAIRDLMGEAEPAARVVPTVLPAFTDSRWFRGAFPDCVAYGFMPQPHQGWHESWPLVHGNDERIDTRDLGFAARFFHDLPGRLLSA